MALGRWKSALCLPCMYSANLCIYSKLESQVIFEKGVHDFFNNSAMFMLLIKVLQPVPMIVCGRNTML